MTQRVLDPRMLDTGTALPAMSGANLTGLPWTFVSSSTISASSEIAFTNMVSGYEYEYVFSNIVAAVDGTTFKAELGIAGPTYRTSSYLAAVKVINEAGTSNSDEQTTYLPLIFAGDGFGTGTNEELFYGRIWLHDPAAAGTKTGAIWDIGNRGSTPETDGFHGYGQYTTAEAHTAIRFFAGSGNLSSGVIKQYRRATS